MGPDMDLGASLTVGDLRGPTLSRRRWAPIACLSALVVIGISQAEAPVLAGVFGRDLLAPDSDVVLATEADDHEEMAKKRGDVEAREQRLEEKEQKLERKRRDLETITEKDLMIAKERADKAETDRRKEEIALLRLRERISKGNAAFDRIENDKALARKDRKEQEFKVTIIFIVVAIVVIIGVSGYAMSRCSCGPGVQGGPDGGGNLVVAGKTELKNHGR